MTVVGQEPALVRVENQDGWIDFDPRSVMQAPRGSGSLFPQVSAGQLPLDCRAGLEREVDVRAMGAQATADAEVFLKGLWGQLRDIRDPARRLFQVMAAGRYRAGAVADTDFEGNWDRWQGRLTDAVRTQTPISVVLPSFPFKAPNPLKNRRRLPDMAELLCLTRLWEITEAIRLVHPPGAVFTILSEGRIYGPLFEVSAYEAELYRAGVERMIDQLGAAGALRVADLVDDVVGPWRSEFETLRRTLEPGLRDWWERHPEDEHRRYLVRNLAASVHLPKETAEVFSGLLNTALTGEPLTEAAQGLHRVRASVEHRADQAAFTYTLLLASLKLTNVIERYDPRAIRATVHPKPGQWGIHLVNKRTSLYPWHGVAVRKASGSWRLRTELDAMRQGALPVYTGGNPLPFYYQEP